MLGHSLVSSVGRAFDCRSKCHWFDSGTGESAHAECGETSLLIIGETMGPYKNKAPDQDCCYWKKVRAKYIIYTTNIHI